MIKNVSTTETLFDMATRYHDMIKEQFHADDPESCIARITELGSLMATTGKMLADARYWRDQAMKHSIITHLKDARRSSLPASILNELNKAECKEFNYLVNWIEQIDKEVKYQHDALITVVSYRKQEMMRMQYQP